MSLPDKCPFCGAGVHVMEDGKACKSQRWVEFECYTSIHAVAPRPSRSPNCKDAERDTLAARVAELEARCKRLEEAGDAMADWNMNERNLGCDPELSHKWKQAKEAKP